MAVLDELLASWQGQQDRANAANELRYSQGMEILDQIIGNYESGGSFEKATEAALKRGETQSVTRGVQSLVSSGLSNTTQAAGLSKKFEEEVGAPTRLRAADIAAQRLTSAQNAKVGFIERREDTGPAFGDIASLISQISRGQSASSYSNQSRPRTASDDYNAGDLWGFGSSSSTQTSAAQRRADAAAKTQTANDYFNANRAQPSEKKPKLDIKFQTPIYGQGFTGPVPGGDIYR